MAYVLRMVQVKGFMFSSPNTDKYPWIKDGNVYFTFRVDASNPLIIWLIGAYIKDEEKSE